MSRSIKLVFEGETIRLSLSEPVQHPTLLAAVTCHWSFLDSQRICLCYDDDDGETILLSPDDRALSDALTHHSGPVLRLIVKRREALAGTNMERLLNATDASQLTSASVRCDPASTPHQDGNKSHSSLSNPAVHDGVRCDGCGMYPLLGPLYTCGFCANFHFCLGCHCRGARLHDASHPWWMTPSPGATRVHAAAPAPSVHSDVACNGCGASPIIGTRWICAVCRVRCSYSIFVHYTCDFSCVSLRISTSVEPAKLETPLLKHMVMCMPLHTRC